jgi:hypothetical protein|tara:strand:- start:392 stop:745 length:354 start_codon:yes stop_codon:yes gene_type:complete
MPYKPNKMMMADAQRAIDYNDRVSPSQRWGTPTGRRRAGQIARGEELSPDIIVRMLSFLSRSKANYERYVGADKKGKGYYAYLGWGGPSAVGWAEDKIRKMRAAGELPGGPDSGRRG